MLLIASERFEEHVTPPGHPERMERCPGVHGVPTAGPGRDGRIDPRAGKPRGADPRPRSSVPRLDCGNRRPRGQLDADTYTSPESVEIAALAAARRVQAAEHALRHGEPRVRWCGRRATMPSGSGNGLLPLQQHRGRRGCRTGQGTDRVAIVDIDVHHGNGSQWMFYDDPPCSTCRAISSLLSRDGSRA
jgi:acetoin utilization deacetylase AcuC-like enzyme